MTGYFLFTIGLGIGMAGGFIACALFSINPREEIHICPICRGRSDHA